MKGRLYNTNIIPDVIHWRLSVSLPAPEGSQLAMLWKFVAELLWMDFAENAIARIWILKCV